MSRLGEGNGIHVGNRSPEAPPKCPEKGKSQDPFPPVLPPGENGHSNGRQDPGDHGACFMAEVASNPPTNREKGRQSGRKPDGSRDTTGNNAWERPWTTSWVRNHEETSPKVLGPALLDTCSSGQHDTHDALPPPQMAPCSKYPAPNLCQGSQPHDDGTDLAGPSVTRAGTSDTENRLGFCSQLWPWPATAPTGFSSWDGLSDSVQWMEGKQTRRDRRELCEIERRILERG